MQHTMRTVLGWGAFAALMLAGLDAAAQCSKDTDCKGNRVCFDGKCMEPSAPATPIPPAPTYQPPAYQQPVSPYQQPAPAYQQPAPAYQQLPPAYQQPAPAYQQPASPYQQPVSPYQQPMPVYSTAYRSPAALAVPAGPLQWYQTFYGHIGGLLGFHGWGSMSIAGQDLTISGKFKGGLHLSAYVPISPVVHLGGYFNLGSGDMKLEENGRSMTNSVDHYSIGFSLKAGSRLAERIWLGFVGDLGLYALDPSGSETWYGLDISPRIHLDVLGLDVGGFKMGFFASFGPSIVPYASGSISGQDGSAYLIYLQLHIGATFGA